MQTPPASFIQCIEFSKNIHHRIVIDEGEDAAFEEIVEAVQFPGQGGGHAGLVIIYQENFRLLLYRNNDFAVVIIIDDENVSHYYKKSVDSGGLEFLYEQ